MGGRADRGGGLLGYNDGTISQSYATGAVIGSIRRGVLVGFNLGTVSQSYATGAVSGSSSMGWAGRAITTAP